MLQNLMSSLRSGCMPVDLTVARNGELDLSGHPLDAVGCQTLASCLLGTHGVKALKLDRCGINDDGISAIARALTNDKFIISLELRQNAIGPIGLTYLSNALVGNTTLTICEVDGNAWTEADSPSLVSIVETCEVRIEFRVAILLYTVFYFCTLPCLNAAQ